MINPFKTSEGLNSFFVSLEGNQPLSGPHSQEVKFCKPDMDWIYNKCMMKSAEFRESLETNSKAKVVLHPLLRKDPEIKKFVKARLVNPNQGPTSFDLTIATPVFNNCALAYQDHCRRFYERRSLEEKFQLD